MNSKLRTLLIMIFMVILICILPISLWLGIPLRTLLGYGPLSFEEALNVQGLPPIYRPNSISNYANLDVIYYYAFHSAELKLDTYFAVKNSRGKVVRVAKMVTYRHQIVSGVTISEKQVPITWAETNYGRVCEVPLDEVNYDHISGVPYQSCLYWYGQGVDLHLLYTIWSEEETVNFVNSLVPAKKDDLNEP